MKFVDIPTAVEARFEEDGRVTPMTFRWRGRDVRISDVGRRWTEPHDPHQFHHYLVMTPAHNTFELCLDTATMQWKITRVWERERVA